jgi:hypothetical protein
VDATVLAIVRMGLGVITERLLTLCSLWMTFGVTCWAMYAPTAERLQIAGGFAIIVFVPSLWSERKKAARAETNASDGT